MLVRSDLLLAGNAMIVRPLASAAGILPHTLSADYRQHTVRIASSIPGAGYSVDDWVIIDRRFNGPPSSANGATCVV
jgi:hypothetical protein